MEKTKAPNKKRCLQIDLFKAFAIICIVLWHFNVIETWAFVWAIPVFVFITASLYQGKLEKITLKKALFSMLWIFGIIIIFTLIANFLNFPKIHESKLNYSLTSIISYFILVNPYFGNLWYFLLYFQIMFVLIVMGKINQEQFKKPIIGIILFIFSVSFSYGLLLTVGKGVTLNFISWIFLIWLGVFYFSDISSYFNKIKNSTLLKNVIITLSLVLIILLIGNDKLVGFLSKHTHDFIFPTIILQGLYFILLFSLTELMSRFLPEKFNEYIGVIGAYSLYIYIFHYFLYCVFFNPMLGSAGIPLVIISCIGIGYTLDKIKVRILK